MGYRVDNAIIMAAGTASRFAPLSYERPKALIEVKGEVLIERQIRQLRDAGIEQIIVVVGYRKEQFYYLREKFGVIIVENNDYLHRNNNGSIWAAREYLRNSYICSSDNYFSFNPFETEVDDAYYAALYSIGPTQEWCITSGKDGYIDKVVIGGSDAWFMMGHTFWSEDFSRRFLQILEPIYNESDTVHALWETIYMRHLDTLKMRIRQYESDAIFEFDTLDELRKFDSSYITDTRSAILKELADKLGCQEAEMVEITACKADNNAAAGIRFRVKDTTYQYTYGDRNLTALS